MKKSDQYRAAQLAVLRDSHIRDEDKLEIIHTLISDENMASFGEEREAKEDKA